MRAGVWLVLLAVGALLLAAVVFVSGYEKVGALEAIAPQPAAYEDPFLAAKNLLDALGVAHRSVHGLQGQMQFAAGTALVLPRKRTRVSAPNLQRLLAAVDAGAQLIVEAELVGTDDPWLDALQIGREPGSGDVGDSWRARTDALTLDELVEVRISADQRLRVHMVGGPDLRYAHRSVWSASAEKRIDAVHFSKGAGRVTVVRDLNWLRNWELARADHAELFAQLLKAGEVREVVFLRQTSVGLFAWVWQHAWRVLLALGVLIALWLWALVPRAGAIQPDADLDRRRLLDHLRASGRLLWSLGARTPMLAHARAAAVQRLLQHFPHLRDRDLAVQAEFLQTRLGLSPLHAQCVLTADALAGPSTFIVVVRACQQLHLALEQPRPPRSTQNA